MRSLATTTDGWRGRPGPDWAEPQLLAALDHCAAQGVLGEHVLIGHDARAGAREVAHLAADLLAHHGLTTYLASAPGPTPAFGSLVHRRSDLTAAVVVTASHNPPGYIGIKVRDRSGHGIPWPQPPAGAALDPGLLEVRHHQRTDVLSPYVGAVGDPLSTAAGTFDGDVLLDAAHGAVGVLAGRLTGVRVLRGRPLPFFAGQSPDPVPRVHAEHTGRALLDQLAHRERALLAMTDGDGDRLVLFTHRSGYIPSAEQAAALLYAGLPVRRLITTQVAPRMALRAARRAQPGLKVTETSVGFKHLVGAWREQPVPALALEPNGALVHVTGPDGYFERDALTALTILLRTFASLEDLDDAIQDVRQAHPHTQLVHTTPSPLTDVLRALPGLLPTWRADIAGEVAHYDDGAHGHIAVRASGTEPGTRLYIEAPAETAELLTRTLGGPAFKLSA
ncbi:hypothetical protein ACIP93_34705 [Streptomyces sp. NPDC088745]|uniref:hypothetical protein n=1 Tax=Streptomyces sp. NPDC088745 TaxID=3365884 RepID=UPI0037F2FF50